MRACQRMPLQHRSNEAIYIMERVECPACGHREVLYVCQQCADWIANAERRGATIVCQGCHRSKPKPYLPYPVRILGKA